MKQATRNRSRANRIALALRSVRAYDGADDWRATITDALSDLRHLCDKHDLDMGALDHSAHQHYLAELHANPKPTLGDLYKITVIETGKEA